MKTFLELYDELKEKSKGVYYYMNLRKKKGISRPKGHPKAPSEDDLKRAAQTAKEQLYDRIGPTAKLMKPILVKPKPLGTAPKLGGQTKRGQMVRPKPPKLPESQVADTKAIHVRQNQARRQKQQQELETAKQIDAREKEKNKRDDDQRLDRARTQDTARKNIQTEAPSLAVLKKKIKSGTKLGSTETASAKARGLIPRADGTKRKSPKYK